MELHWVLEIMKSCEKKIGHCTCTYLVKNLPFLVLALDLYPKTATYIYVY
jgi:hypothetical protein